MAVSHMAAKNMTFLSCLFPAIDQQIGEVMMTITGDYTVYERVNGNGTALKEVPLASLQEDAHLVNDSGVGDEFCLRSGCHDFTREVLTKVEMPGMTKNPHMWLNQAHMNVEFACGDCH
ncbi:MAG: hypothetical protein IJ131_01150 [Eggerthellaceae bacterium]|nr:hypothetical protein [Eggerthellaceae bacterium]